MKKRKQLVAFLLALLMVAGAIRIPIGANAANGEGMTFSKSRTYTTSENFGDAPKTYEATIKIPSGFRVEPV